MTNERFIDQARKDYMGEPHRIARCQDKYGEQHVIIEMVLSHGQKHYLDWIGAEFAREPDEFGDEPPFQRLKWKKIA